MGFWGDNFGSRHARIQARALSTRKIIYFPQKGSAKISAHWIGVQGSSKLVKKKKTPHFASPSQANPSPKSKNYLLIKPRRLASSVEG